MIRLCYTILCYIILDHIRRCMCAFRNPENHHRYKTQLSGQRECSVPSCAWDDGAWALSVRI